MEKHQQRLSNQIIKEENIGLICILYYIFFFVDYYITSKFEHSR